MPKKEIKDSKKELKTWETRVDVMGYFEMPNHYAANSETGKYARFTGYMKEWMTWLFTSKDNSCPFAKLGNDKDSVPQDWWNVAMKVGRGKNVENTLPTLPDFAVDDADKDLVFDTFLPAYRALTEKFEKRSVFQWIFNHSQYTAERDSINALKGVITTLLKCSTEEIDEKLREYQKNVPNSGRSKSARARQSSDYKIEKKINRYYEKEAAKKNMSVEEWRKQNVEPEDVHYDDSFINLHFDDENVKNGDEIKEPANVSHKDLNDGLLIDKSNDDLFNKSFVIEDDKDLEGIQNSLIK